MINFRFHVVSLIAIFLALALGIVIGAGVIERGLVNTLNDRLDRVEAKSDRIKRENNELNDENNQLKRAIQGMQPDTVNGRLTADAIGIVAVRGVDGDQVKATLTAAQQAGAIVPGTLWLEPKWNLDKSDDVKTLQDVLGVTTKNKSTLRAEAWRQLGARLAEPPATSNTSDDLLAQLQQAGFLGFDANGNASISAFPGRNGAVALLVGTHGAVPASIVVMAGASALHANEVPALVADLYDADASGAAGRGSALQPLRDSDLARTVSTVDDLDNPEGPTTVVLALADLLRTPAKVGHYGYASGTRPLPDPAGA
jgi:hypothetical protein